MRVAHVILPQVKIGDQIILLSIGLIGTATWTATDEGGELSLAASIRILDRACIPAESHTLDELHDQMLQPMSDRGNALLERDGHVVILDVPMFRNSSPEPGTTQLTCATFGRPDHHLRATPGVE